MDMTSWMATQSTSTNSDFRSRSKRWMQPCTSVTRGRPCSSLMRNTGGWCSCPSGVVAVNDNIGVVVMLGSCRQCQKLDANILECFHSTVIFIFLVFFIHSQLWWSDRQHGQRLPTIHWERLSWDRRRNRCCYLWVWYETLHFDISITAYCEIQFSSSLNFNVLPTVFLSGYLYFFRKNLRFEYSYTYKKVYRVLGTNSILNCWCLTTLMKNPGWKQHFKPHKCPQSWPLRVWMGFDEKNFVVFCAGHPKMPSYCLNYWIFEYLCFLLCTLWVYGQAGSESESMAGSFKRLHPLLVTNYFFFFFLGATLFNSQ